MEPDAVAAPHPLGHAGAGARPFPVADREVLALAAAVIRYPARREELALERFGLTPRVLWERVDELLADSATEAAMPIETLRLRRRREMRKRVRGDAPGAPVGP
ncbi:DUF3263 domain-containing protein [Nocardioides sp. Iso805N]|uniref:DUF3263 domain-containing protein n=1 Tax=Nocardioides sp. Iso805N TaxID=1283287 RepID=UPI0003705454|nr:DUF3263 domain-containing protein [Nocardioides sp. Iso805N]